MAQDPAKTTATPAEVEGWRPTAGDVLTGTVMEVNKAWSDYTDSYYPIVVIRERDTDKVFNVHCFHEILKQRMMDTRPEIGSELEIECLGEKKTKDGKRSYVAYRVTVPGETGAHVWEDLSGQGGRASQAAKSPQGSMDDIPF